MKIDIELINRTTVISPKGRLDAVTAPEVEERLLSLAGTVDAPVVLDLGGLEYVSSTGIQAFIRFSKALAARGQALWLCNPTPFVAEVLEISRLSRYFDIRASRDEAIEASVTRRSA